MSNWNVILTSSVVSALITGVIGVLIKGALDRKLDNQRQKFEEHKMTFTTVTQKELEMFKSEISQSIGFKQKNLEYYHSMNQVAQNKRLESIEHAWKNYLEVRNSISPLVGFFTTLLTKEYLSVIEQINEDKDPFNLKSIDTNEIPFGVDPLPNLRELENYRLYLGESLYFKFRSGMCILFRVRYLYFNMVRTKEVCLWNEDNLISSHLSIIFMNNDLTPGEITIDISNPLSMLNMFGAIELEINKTIEYIITGEESAELSLRRVRMLNQGIR